MTAVPPIRRSAHADAAALRLEESEPPPDRPPEVPPPTAPPVGPPRSAIADGAALRWLERCCPLEGD